MASIGFPSISNDEGVSKCLWKFEARNFSAITVNVHEDALLTVVFFPGILQVSSLFQKLMKA